MISIILIYNHLYNYRISFCNKRPRRLLNFEVLLEGGAYIKVTEIIHMKFQNFVQFFFQVTINNCHYDI